MAIPGPNAPLVVHHCWRRVYDYCIETFTSIQGYGRKDAELSASAVVGTYYTAAGRPRAEKRAYQLPRMGEMVTLGWFRRLWTADPDGTVYVAEEANMRTPLLWSQRMSCCVVFPGLKPGEQVDPTKRQDNLLRMWARGRGARKANRMTVPEPMMQPGKAAIAIEYYSDKFSHGRGIHYVHHHEADVLAATSAKLRRCGSPVAVWLHGGNLRITPDGLEG